MDLNGTGGDVVLLFYIVGGLATIGSGLLPGSSKGWRAFSIIAGLVMTIWAAYVLMFGGWIIISFKILLMPVILVIRAISAAVKRNKNSTQPAFQAAGPTFPAAAPGGFPPAPAPGGYPAPQMQGGYPAPQSAPPMQGGYPAPQSAPPMQGGYPAPQPGYAAPQMPPAQPAYPGAQGGYAPPAQGVYPAPQPGYPAPQPGYAPPAPQQGYQPPAG